MNNKPKEPTTAEMQKNVSRWIAEYALDDPEDTPLVLHYAEILLESLAEAHAELELTKSVANNAHIINKNLAQRQLKQAQARLDSKEKELSAAVVDFSVMQQIISEQKHELKQAQARLDAVMLEYCPNEMTTKQMERWLNAQTSTDCNVEIVDMVIKGEQE